MLRAKVKVMLRVGVRVGLRGFRLCKGEGSVKVRVNTMFRTKVMIWAMVMAEGVRVHGRG